MHRIPFLACLLCCISCADSPPTRPETLAEEDPNASNTAIYDVDPDDPYEINDSSFLGMTVGTPIADFDRLLRSGSIRMGAEEFAGLYIVGTRGDTLGFVVPRPGEDRIESITITSPDAVTKQGMRVGYTFGELRERVGNPSVYGSEIDARVYAEHGHYVYRLDMLTDRATIPPDSVPGETPITLIEIR